jgi:hypothetical protein
LTLRYNANMPSAIQWTPEESALQDAICDAISTQPRGMGAILEELGNPINPSTFYRWLQQDDDLCKRYARARADQAQVMADEITQIADTTQEGVITTEKADGSVEIKRSDMLEHRKLRIESRKWLAAKLLPKVYGDRVQQEHTGPDGGPLQFVTRSILDAKE